MNKRNADDTDWGILADGFLLRRKEDDVDLAGMHALILLKVIGITRFSSMRELIFAENRNADKADIGGFLFKIGSYISIRSKIYS